MWPGKSSSRRARLYQTLAVALDAGLGIEQALDLTGARPHRAPGGRLSAVLQHDHRIPEREASVLSAAESAGVLPAVLRQLGELLETRAVAQRKLALRLLYPVLLLHAAAILPNLRWLILGDVSDFLGRVVPVLLLLWGLAAIAGVALAWCRRTLRTSPAFAAALRRVPVIGGLVQKSGAGTYAHLLSLLLAAGVPLGTALEDSARCCGNAQLENSGLRITEDVVRRGEGMTTAFHSESRVWPRLLLEAIHNGEATGRLEETLAGAAEGLRQEADRRVELLLTVVPAFVYLVAAVYVAWVVITTFTGLYSAI